MHAEPLVPWQRNELHACRSLLDTLGALLQDPQAQPHEFEILGSRISQEAPLVSVFGHDLRARFVLAALECAEEGARRRREGAYRAAGVAGVSLPDLISDLKDRMDELECGAPRRTFDPANPADARLGYVPGDSWSELEEINADA